MILALISTLPDQLAALQAWLEVDCSQSLAGPQVHLGRLAGHEVLLGLSGIGKVEAATIAALLHDHFEVRAKLFTGVAVTMGAHVRVSDVVEAQEDFSTTRKLTELRSESWQCASKIATWPTP